MAGTVVLLLSVALVILYNRREKGPSHPAKQARWRALPLRFKLACWFVVTPLFLAGPLLFVTGQLIAGLVFHTVAIAALVVLESRAVRWYGQHGFLPS